MVKISKKKNVFYAIKKSLTSWRSLEDSLSSSIIQNYLMDTLFIEFLNNLFLNHYLVYLFYQLIFYENDDIFLLISIFLINFLKKKDILSIQLANYIKFIIKNIKFL